MIQSQLMDAICSCYVQSIGHNGRVTSVHVTNDYIISGSEDLAVIVWDLTSALLVHRIRYANLVQFQYKSPSKFKSCVK